MPLSSLTSNHHNYSILCGEATGTNRFKTGFYGLTDMPTEFQKAMDCTLHTGFRRCHLLSRWDSGGHKREYGRPQQTGWGADDYLMLRAEHSSSVLASFREISYFGWVTKLMRTVSPLNFQKIRPYKPSNLRKYWEKVAFVHGSIEPSTEFCFRFTYAHWCIFANHWKFVKKNNRSCGGDKTRDCIQKRYWSYCQNPQLLSLRFL